MVEVVSSLSILNRRLSKGVGLALSADAPSKRLLGGTSCTQPDAHLIPHYPEAARVPMSLPFPPFPAVSGMKVLQAWPHSDTHYSGIDGLPPPCYSVKIRKQRPFLGEGIGFVSIQCVRAGSIINSGSQSNMT